MLTTIAAIAAVLVALTLAFAATKPDTFRVERTVTIAAPPEAIYPYLADFQKWEAWSPYEKLDPALKRTFSGIPETIGAGYAWDGNKKAGAGSMEIKETHPPLHLSLFLNFTRPIQANNLVDFTLTPEGAQTTVSWAMVGQAPYLVKVMQMLINMDKMVGKDFAVGLANLKAVAERAGGT